MNNSPSSTIHPAARWAWFLSLLTALIWIVVAVSYGLRAWQSQPDNPLIRWTVALVMLGIAAGAVWLGNGLHKQRKLFYYLSLAFLGANVVPPIFDDFGLADLIYVLYVITLLVLLILVRKTFTGNKTKEGRTDIRPS